ncbi:MAG: agmatine deiminase family protein [Anaerolineae bacterium]
MLNKFLRFEQIIYPLWRRAVPAFAKPFMATAFNRFAPVYADQRPPQSIPEMARFLIDWEIIPDADLQSVCDALEAVDLPIAIADRDAHPRQHDGSPLHIPAQWEPTERVLMSWGRMYPAIWEMHAQMAEAISQVATIEILAPTELWARAIATYLQRRGRAKLAQVQLLVLRTDDIWIRDYGPIVGIAANGQRVALNATYDVLPQYPQADDNGMTARWSAHHDLAVQPLDLHTEGGNLWSDGQGTLIMSSQIFYSNRYYTRDTLLDYLHRVLQFEKLIITPRLTLEETGHVDLLVKLGSADTVFVSRADSFSTEEVLRKTKRLFERETNAHGNRYQVVELPTPSLYLNWFTYTIRRGYTNALTVNNQVLVPVFGIKQDDQALRIYQQHMPGYRIVPIESAVGINGGGAVHCMTKEIPSIP